MQNLMPPVNTPDNLFHDGNEATGVEGTILYAEFMNNEQSAIQDVQQEVINVLAEAGLTPDPAKQNQLLLAIQAVISDGVSDGIQGVVKSVNTITPGDNGDVELPMYGTGTAAVQLPTTDTLTVLKSYGGGKFVVSGGSADMPTNAVSYSLDWVAMANVGSASVHGTVTATALSDAGGAKRTTYHNVCRSGVWQGWDKSFSVNNPPTATQTNALPLTGGTMAGEIQSTSANIWRGIQGDYGSIWRMDADNSYFLLTNQGDPTGYYNSLRPLAINNNTGNVNIGTALSVDSVNSIYKTGINSYSDGGGSYHQTNGMTLQGVGDQVGEMYFLENIGQYALMGLHARSGGRDAWYEFRNDGNIFANGTNVAPVGVIEAWPSDTPPPGWLICNGTGFNTGLFPNLALIFPSGQLPDLRGAFLRGKDNGKGVDPDRELLSIQPGQAPASAIGGGEWGNYAGRDTGHTATTGTDNSGSYHVKQETEAQRETRPYNVAINYIVRSA